MTLDGAKFICLDEAGNRGKIIEAKGRKFSVGYYTSCDLTIDDERAKGVHCTIECDAFGRITIRNSCPENPISINGEIVENKRVLFNKTVIKILDKTYFWEFETKTIKEFEDLESENVSTPQKQIGIPQHSAFSCPGIKHVEHIEPRFTVHNFAYCIQSDEEGNTSLETSIDVFEEQPSSTTAENVQELASKSEEKSCDDSLKQSTQGENQREVTPEPEIAKPEAQETPKMNLINFTNDKENSASTQKKTHLQLSLCHQSDVVITSFSPRETGVKTEKSFTAILKPKVLVTTLASNTPKSVYSTPKSILLDDDDVVDEIDKSKDIINFHTPSTSRKATKNLKNTSMHLVDFTTPNKLAPASPYLKSALKASAKKHPITLSSSGKIATSKANEGDLGVSALPNTPIIVVDEIKNDQETPSSIISVNSTDTSSVIEILSDESTPGNNANIILKTPVKKDAGKSQATTPMRTPQSLMKRALLTSTKKQMSTPKRQEAPSIATPTGTPRREPINRIPLRTSIGALRSPSTPKPTRPDEATTRRISMSAPSRKSMSAASVNRAESSTPMSNKKSFMTPSNSRRSSLIPMSASRAQTSTPFSHSNRNKSACRTSPLSKVRKSVGGIPLSTHISKARRSLINKSHSQYTSIKEKSPQQVMSDRLVTRARKSIAATSMVTPSPSILKSKGISSRKSIAPQTVLFAERKESKKLVKEDEADLSVTFIIESDDEDKTTEKMQKTKLAKDVEECSSEKSSQKMDSEKGPVLNVTFSPEKESTDNKQTDMDVPIDVEELVQNVENDDQEEVQEKKTCTLEKEAEDGLVEAHSGEEIEKHETEESFAEIIPQEELKDCKLPIVEQTKNVEQPKTDGIEIEVGFGEESLANQDSVCSTDDVNEQKISSDIIELDSSNDTNNKSLPNTNISQETIEPNVTLDKLSIYKPICEDITLEGSLIEKDTKELSSLNETNKKITDILPGETPKEDENPLNGGVVSSIGESTVKLDDSRDDTKNEIVEQKPLKEEFASSNESCDSEKITEPNVSLTEPEHDPKDEIQVESNVEEKSKETNDVINQEEQCTPEDIQAFGDSDRVDTQVTDVPANVTLSEDSLAEDQIENQTEERKTEEVVCTTVSSNLQISKESIKEQEEVSICQEADSSVIIQGNEHIVSQTENTEKLSIIIDTKIPPDMETTSKLLEEIEDVLNKSDEIQQKHLGEQEDSESLPTLTDENESLKLTQESVSDYQQSENGGAETSEDDTVKNSTISPEDSKEDENTPTVSIENGGAETCENDPIKNSTTSPEDENTPTVSKENTETSEDDTVKNSTTSPEDTKEDENTPTIAIENTETSEDDTVKNSTTSPEDENTPTIALEKAETSEDDTVKNSTTSPEDTKEDENIPKISIDHNVKPMEESVVNEDIDKILKEEIVPETTIQQVLSSQNEDNPTKSLQKLIKGSGSTTGTPKRRSRRASLLIETQDDTKENIDASLQTVAKKLSECESEMVFSPRRSSRRKSNCMESDGENNNEVKPLPTFTPRRSTRRASMSSNETASSSSYTPSKKTRRASLSAVSETPLTPKRITRRRSSISLDTEEVVKVVHEANISSHDVTPQLDIMGEEINEDMGAIIEEEEEEEEVDNLAKNETKIEDDIKIADTTKGAAEEDVNKIVGEINEADQKDSVGNENKNADTAIELDSSIKEDESESQGTIVEPDSTQVIEEPVVEENVPASTEGEAKDKDETNVCEDIPDDISQEEDMQALLISDDDDDDDEDMPENTALLTPKLKKSVRIAADSPRTPAMSGMRDLLRTPKAAQKTPQFAGIRDLVRTPKETRTETEEEEIEKLQDVQELVMTPKAVSNTKEMVYDEEQKDLGGGVEENMAAKIEHNESIAIKSEDNIDNVMPKDKPEMLEIPKVSNTPVSSCAKELLDTTKEVNVKDVDIVDNEVEMEKTSEEDLCQLQGVKELLKTPKGASTPRLGGLREMMETPKLSATPAISGVKELMEETPTKADVNIETLQSRHTIASATTEMEVLTGVKELLNTPKSCKTPHFKGMRELLQTPKLSSTPVLAGVKELLDDSQQMTTNEETVNPTQLETSPEEAKVKEEDLKGLKELMNTPKAPGTPRFEGMRKLLQTPKVSTTPTLGGVKELLDTPKPETIDIKSEESSADTATNQPKTPLFEGMRELMKTPKVSTSPALGGVQELLETPKQAIEESNDSEEEENDKDLKGVKELMNTPKVQGTPRFEGMRNLLQTPKQRSTPTLGGVKELLDTPKQEANIVESEDSNTADTTPTTPHFKGMRELMKTPKVSSTPALGGVKELLETPVQAIDENMAEEENSDNEKEEKVCNLRGVRELLNTPTSCATPRFSGMRELMRTPKVCSSPTLGGVKELLEFSEDEHKADFPTTSSTEEAHKELKGVKELMNTPKRCSTPRLKGLRELMQTPKMTSTPVLGGLKELMDTPKPTDEEENLDKFLKTPTAKNIMIPTLPSSAIIEKREDSVEMVHSTEYDLNDSNDASSAPLGDLFKTPVATGFVERITASYYGEQDEVEEQQPGRQNPSDTGNQTPLRKGLQRKSLLLNTPKFQSPFTAAEILSDLSKSEVEDWVGKIDPLQQTLNMEEAEGADTSLAELNETKPKASLDQSSNESLSVVPETCSKTTAVNTSEAMINLSSNDGTASKDPLAITASKSTNVIKRPRTPVDIEADISGINLLDQTGESALDGSLLVSDDDDEEHEDGEKSANETLNEPISSDVEEDHNNTLCDYGNDLSQSLLVSDTEDNENEPTEDSENIHNKEETAETPMSNSPKQGVVADESLPSSLETQIKPSEKLAKASSIECEDIFLDDSVDDQIEEIHKIETKDQETLGQEQIEVTPSHSTNTGQECEDIFMDDSVVSDSIESQNDNNNKSVTGSFGDVMVETVSSSHADVEIVAAPLKEEENVITSSSVEEPTEECIDTTIQEPKPDEETKQVVSLDTSENPSEPEDTCTAKEITNSESIAENEAITSETVAEKSAEDTQIVEKNEIKTTVEKESPTIETAVETSDKDSEEGRNVLETTEIALNTTSTDKEVHEEGKASDQIEDTQTEIPTQSENSAETEQREVPMDAENSSAKIAQEDEIETASSTLKTVTSEKIETADIMEEDKSAEQVTESKVTLSPKPIEILENDEKLLEEKTERDTGVSEDSKLLDQVEMSVVETEEILPLVSEDNDGAKTTDDVQSTTQEVVSEDIVETLVLESSIQKDADSIDENKNPEEVLSHTELPEVSETSIQVSNEKEQMEEISETEEEVTTTGNKTIAEEATISSEQNIMVDEACANVVIDKPNREDSNADQSNEKAPLEIPADEEISKANIEPTNVEEAEEISSLSDEKEQSSEKSLNVTKEDSCIVEADVQQDAPTTIEVEGNSVPILSLSSPKTVPHSSSKSDESEKNIDQQEHQKEQNTTISSSKDPNEVENLDDENSSSVNKVSSSTVESSTKSDLELPSKPVKEDKEKVEAVSKSSVEITTPSEISETVQTYNIEVTIKDKPDEIPTETASNIKTDEIVKRYDMEVKIEDITDEKPKDVGEKRQEEVKPKKRSSRKGSQSSLCSDDGIAELPKSSYQNRRGSKTEEEEISSKSVEELPTVSEEHDGQEETKTIEEKVSDNEVQQTPELDEGPDNLLQTTEDEVIKETSATSIDQQCEPTTKEQSESPKATNQKQESVAKTEIDSKETTKEAESPFKDEPGKTCVVTGEDELSEITPSEQCESGLEESTAQTEIESKEMVKKTEASVKDVSDEDQTEKAAKPEEEPHVTTLQRRTRRNASQDSNHEDITAHSQSTIDETNKLEKIEKVVHVEDDHSEKESGTQQDIAEISKKEENEKDTLLPTNKRGKRKASQDTSDDVESEEKRDVEKIDEVPTEQDIPQSSCVESEPLNKRSRKASQDSNQREDAAIAPKSVRFNPDDNVLLYKIDEAILPTEEIASDAIVKQASETKSASKTIAKRGRRKPSQDSNLGDEMEKSEENDSSKVDVNEESNVKIESIRARRGRRKASQDSDNEDIATKKSGRSKSNEKKPTDLDKIEEIPQQEVSKSSEESAQVNALKESDDDNNTKEPPVDKLSAEEKGDNEAIAESSLSTDQHSVTDETKETNKEHENITVAKKESANQVRRGRRKASQDSDHEDIATKKSGRSKSNEKKPTDLDKIEEVPQQEVSKSSDESAQVAELKESDDVNTTEEPPVDKLSGEEKEQHNEAIAESSLSTDQHSVTDETKETNKEHENITVAKKESASQVRRRRKASQDSDHEDIATKKSGRSKTNEKKPTDLDKIEEVPQQEVSKSSEESVQVDALKKSDDINTTEEPPVDKLSAEETGDNEAIAEISLSTDQHSVTDETKETNKEHENITVAKKEPASQVRRGRRKASQDSDHDDIATKKSGRSKSNEKKTIDMDKIEEVPQQEASKSSDESGQVNALKESDGISTTEEVPLDKISAEEKGDNEVIAESSLSSVHPSVTDETKETNKEHENITVAKKEPAIQVRRGRRKASQDSDHEDITTKKSGRSKSNEKKPIDLDKIEEVPQQEASKSSHESGQVNALKESDGISTTEEVPLDKFSAEEKGGNEAIAESSFSTDQPSVTDETKETNKEHENITAAKKEPASQVRRGRRKASQDSDHEDMIAKKSGRSKSNEKKPTDLDKIEEVPQQEASKSSEESAQVDALKESDGISTTEELPLDKISAEEKGDNEAIAECSLSSVQPSVTDETKETNKEHENITSAKKEPASQVRRGRRKASQDSDHEDMIAKKSGRSKSNEKNPIDLDKIEEVPQTEASESSEESAKVQVDALKESDDINTTEEPPLDKLSGEEKEQHNEAIADETKETNKEHENIRVAKKEPASQAKRGRRKASQDSNHGDETVSSRKRGRTKSQSNNDLEKIPEASVPSAQSEEHLDKIEEIPQLIASENPEGMSQKDLSKEPGKSNDDAAETHLEEPPVEHIETTAESSSSVDESKQTNEEHHQGTEVTKKEPANQGRRGRRKASQDSNHGDEITTTRKTARAKSQTKQSGLEQIKEMPGSSSQNEEPIAEVLGGSKNDVRLLKMEKSAESTSKDEATEEQPISRRGRQHHHEVKSNTATTNTRRGGRKKVDPKHDDEHQGEDVQKSEEHVPTERDAKDLENKHTEDTDAAIATNTRRGGRKKADAKHDNGHQGEDVQKSEEHLPTESDAKDIESKPSEDTKPEPEAEHTEHTRKGARRKGKLDTQHTEETEHAEIVEPSKGRGRRKAHTEIDSSSKPTRRQRGISTTEDDHCAHGGDEQNAAKIEKEEEKEHVVEEESPKKDVEQKDPVIPSHDSETIESKSDNKRKRGRKVHDEHEENPKTATEKTPTEAENVKDDHKSESSRGTGRTARTKHDDHHDEKTTTSRSKRGRKLHEEEETVGHGETLSSPEKPKPVRGTGRSARSKVNENEMVQHEDEHHDEKVSGRLRRGRKAQEDHDHATDKTDQVEDKEQQHHEGEEDEHHDVKVTTKTKRGRKAPLEHAAQEQEEETAVHNNESEVKAEEMKSTEVAEQQTSPEKVKAPKAAARSKRGRKVAAEDEVRSEETTEESPSKKPNLEKADKETEGVEDDHANKEKVKPTRGTSRNVRGKHEDDHHEDHDETKAPGGSKRKAVSKQVPAGRRRAAANRKQDIHEDDHDSEELHEVPSGKEQTDEQLPESSSTMEHTAKSRRRKESHTEKEDHPQTDSAEPTTPQRQQSTNDKLPKETPESEKRTRDLPQRRAAIAHQSYDETSDSEKPEKKKKKTDSPRKAIETIKPTIIETIKSSDSSSDQSPALTTTRGRTRKPTARVQQFLEEERAKNESPKKRVGATVATAAVDTPTKRPATKRGAKANVAENPLETTSTPDINKATREEGEKQHVHELEESHQEIAESNQMVDNKTPPAKGRKGARKAKAQETTEEPPAKKSPEELEAEKKLPTIPISEENSTPGRTTGRRNAAAAAIARIEEDAIAAASIEDPKKSKAKKTPAKAPQSLPAKREHRLVSASTVEGVEDLQLAEEPAEEKKPAKRGGRKAAAASTPSITDSPAVIPAKRSRKGKTATMDPSTETIETEEAKTSHATARGRKNVHDKTAATEESTEPETAEKAEEEPAEVAATTTTTTTTKRATRVRRK
ncbi:uncharacterized protein LOC142220346 [Haematobia irritans]|uniref:uncharacterized protein LOC142220346 n=1 Tax=Haematobia irritans TaxID=7368 RepID=UPI003F509E3D